MTQYPQRVVFVNGNYRPELSQFSAETGVELTTDVLHSEYTDGPVRHAFEALSRAFPQQGAHLHIKYGTQHTVKLAIFHIFTGSNVVAQPVNTLFAERLTKAQITEYYIHCGKGGTFGNTACKYAVGAGAHVHSDVVQYGHDDSFHMAQNDAILERDAVFTHCMATLSGKWVRNNTTARIAGSNAEANFYGFYMPSGNELVDNHTIIDHEQPHSQSNELYRGVLGGQGTGVFNGKVYVRQNAQKTNAFQSNGNVLLTDTATMNSKPELEIYADDVKCSHGSTTGQLDEQAMFYLQARGLSRNNARKLLVAAFAESALEKVMDEKVRDLAHRVMEEKLNR
jgi:Fe-S cluster assembly protein SufD